MRCAGHTPLWMVCGGRVFPRQDNCHNTKTLSRSIIIILRAGAGTFTTNAMGFESKPFPPRPSPFPFPHYPIEYSQRDHLAAVCRTAPPPFSGEGSFRRGSSNLPTQQHGPHRHDSYSR